MSHLDSIPPLEADSVEKRRAYAKVNSALFGLPSEPQRLGRYVLLEREGAGAMGVVFSAYDPQLDRKVALKLLRRTETSTDRTRAVLLREARAMARLSHANVVTVHEVGEEAERIFLAMEFAAGGALRNWMKGGPHPWEDVVRVFVKAGHGLAAAHAANLVHRDFKPENILLSASGNPLVADFGLARVGDIVTPATEALGDVEALMLTSGAEGQVGTPAYMAPEVFAGRAADALSDQFSFGVTLFEALYGQRPFRGKTREALAENVMEGRICDVPDAPRVSPAIRSVLARALAADPSARFASMDGLTRALEGGLRGRSRRGLWVVMLAAGSLAMYAGLTVFAPQDPPPLCTGGEERVEDVWSAEKGRRLADSIGGSLAEREQFVERGSRYVADWVDAYREACLDTALRQVQSERQMEDRMLCLDGRIRGFSGVLTAITSQSNADLPGALNALGTLPSLAECGELRSVGFQAPPALREELLQVEEELGQARALEQLRAPEHAISLAEAQVSRARDLGERRLLTRALISVATMEVKSGHPGRARAHIDEARLEAERAGLDLLIVRTLMLSAADSVLSHDLERARRELDVGRAILHRHGGDSKYEGAIAIRLGTLAYSSGHLEQAVGHYRRALEVLERRGGEVAAEVGALVNAGLALRDLGRTSEALVALRDARRRSADAFGPENPGLPSIDLHIAMVLDKEDRLDEALVLLQRALKLSIRTRGPESAEAIQIHAGFGLVYQRLGEPRRALEHSLEAVRILEALDLSEHPDMAMCLGYAGVALVETGRAEEGLELHRRALDINERALGESHPDLSDTLVELAASQQATGDTSGALASLERALKLRVAAQLPSHAIGEVRHALALALRQLDPPRAKQLARQAIDDLDGATALRPDVEKGLRGLAAVE